MKSITVRDLQKRIRETITAAQKHRVVVTRHGKPVALVTGLEGYDWEDLWWATNASFWGMIEESRRQKTIPLEEACRRVKIPLPKKTRYPSARACRIARRRRT